jgi:N-acetylmuramic acid 6-phosphate (MurNAc-6-P) etherase
MMSYMGVTYNKKLTERAISFLMNEFGISKDVATSTLESSGYKLWEAIEKLRGNTAKTE